MGRTTVEIVVSNYRDIHDAESGRITVDQIRRTTVLGIVDTGTARLVLPSAIALQLGLPNDGQSSVRYADHRKEVRDIVKDAHVTLNGRGGVFKAVLEPSRTDALIGAIVMEDLDLLVDCVAQTVYPRDPNTIITEVE